MKKNTTTLLVGIGLVLTASLLLFFRKKEDNNKNIEEEKEKDKVNEKKPEPSKIKVIDEKKNQQIIDKAVRDLIENNEYSSLADLLSDLVSEIVKRSGDIDILYDAPKNIEELEEIIISLGLYDKVSDKLREKNR
jgi:LPXTG-motif cell wall-anchored protein